MDVIISIFIACVGHAFWNIDWFTIYTAISISLSLYKSYLEIRNDKATKR